MGDRKYKSILEDNVRLRRLEISDAGSMLEWMLNADIYKYMQYRPEQQSLESCERFIRNSWKSQENRHWAVSDPQGSYLGTVSLKNIDQENRNAEFAIALMPEAMGKKIGLSAMIQVMHKAFYELDLHKVYLYVREDNKRAIRFYEKCLLRYEGCFMEHLWIDGKFRNIHWYAIQKKEFHQWRDSVIHEG